MTIGSDLPGGTTILTEKSAFVTISVKFTGEVVARATTTLQLLITDGEIKDITKDPQSLPFTAPACQ